MAFRQEDSSVRAVSQTEQTREEWVRRYDLARKQRDSAARLLPELRTRAAKEKRKYEHATRVLRRRQVTQAVLFGAFFAVLAGYTVGSIAFGLGWLFFVPAFLFCAAMTYRHVIVLGTYVPDYPGAAAVQYEWESERYHAARREIRLYAKKLGIGSTPTSQESGQPPVEGVVLRAVLQPEQLHSTQQNA